MKKINNNKGFTLPEIIATIVILGIVIAIAVPSVSKLKDKFDKNYEERIESSAIKAAKAYYKDNKNELPKDTFETSEIYYNALESNDYIKFDNDVENKKVVVLKNENDEYDYYVCPNVENSVEMKKLTDEAQKTCSLTYGEENEKITMSYKDIYGKDINERNQDNPFVFHIDSYTNEEAKETLAATVTLTRGELTKKLDKIYPKNITALAIDKFSSERLPKHKYVTLTYDDGVTAQALIFQHPAPVIDGAIDNKIMAGSDDKITITINKDVVNTIEDDPYRTIVKKIDHFEYEENGTWKTVECDIKDDSCTPKKKLPTTTRIRMVAKGTNSSYQIGEASNEYNITYSSDQCVIVLNPNGGNIDSIDSDWSSITDNRYIKEYTCGEKLGNINTTLTKKGYSFNNTWKTSTGEEYNSETTVPNGSTELYAQWNPKIYTLTSEETTGTQKLYEVYGAKWTTEKSITAEEKTKIEIPTKEGYIFNGYYLNDNLKDEMVVDNNGQIVGSNEMITSDKIIYASWKPITYKVEFYKQDGSGEDMLPLYYEYDSNYTLPKSTFSKEGYVFDGWARSSTGSKELEDESPVSNLSNKNNDIVKLYAVYKARSYTVLFDTNGGNSIGQLNAVYNEVYEITSPIKNFDLNIDSSNTGAKVSNDKISKQMTFEGWSSNDIDTSIAKYGDTSSNLVSWSNINTKIGVNKEKVYIKNLSKKGEKIIFYANYSGSITLPSITNPTGYTCNYINIDQSKTWESNDTYNINTNASSETLYVKCNPIEYKIKLDLNNGTEDDGTTKNIKYDEVFYVDPPLKELIVTINNDVEATVGSEKAKTITLKSNYTNNGWSISNANSSTALYGLEESTLKLLSGSPSSSTVAFFKNLNNKSGETVTLKANWKGTNVILPELRKEGNTCYYDINGTKVLSKGTYENAVDSEIKVVCTENSYNIKYDFNGGEKDSDNLTKYPNSNIKYSNEIGIFKSNRKANITINASEELNNVKIKPSSETNTDLPYTTSKNFEFAGYTINNIDSTAKTSTDKSNWESILNGNTPSYKSLEQRYFKELLMINGTVNVKAKWEDIKYTLPEIIESELNKECYYYEPITQNKYNSLSEYIIKSSISNNIVFEIQCGNNKRTVTADATEGTIIETESSKSNGWNISSSTKATITLGVSEEYSSFPKIENSNLIFDGWYTAKTGGTKISEKSIANQGDTIYAHWKYKVEYLSTENSSYVLKQAIYNYDSNCRISENDTTYTGYTFLNWKNKDKTDTKTYNVNDLVKFNKNTTLYANIKNNEYYINYELNGGTAQNNPTSAKYEIVNVLNKPTKKFEYNIENYDKYTNVTLSSNQGSYNYIFNGWSSDNLDINTAKYGVNSVDKDWYSTGLIISSNSLKFKNLTPINEKTVNIIANWDNSMSIELPKINAPSNYTCNFIDKQTSKKYDSSETYYITDGKTTANFELNCIATYTLTLKANPKSGQKAKIYNTIESSNAGWNVSSDMQTATISVTEGTTIDILPEIITIGYTLENYNVQKSAGLIAMPSLNFSIKVNEDMTMSPIWKNDKYEILLYNNNGKTDPKIYEIYGEKYVNSSDGTISKISVPTKSGYEFSGYYSAKNASGTKIIDASGNILQSNVYFTSDSTIYAAWKVKTYNISFLPNTGSGTMSTIICSSNSSCTLPGNEFSKLGYSFAGWTLDAEYEQSESTILYSNKQSVNFGIDTTLYAQWLPIEYTITTKTDIGAFENGSKYKEYKIKYNTTYGYFEKPTAYGYTFKGWVNGSDKEVNELTIMNTASNHYINAKWEPKNVNIYFMTQGGIFSNGSTTKSMIEVYGETYTFPYQPTRTGYTFNGWYKENSSNGYYENNYLRVYSNNSSYKINSEGPIYLYAGWNPITYTIKYSGLSDNTICNYDSYCNINDGRSLTRPNYKLVGWSYNGKIYELGDYVYNLTTSSSELTFTPVWEELLQDTPQFDIVATNGSYDKLSNGANVFLNNAIYFNGVYYDNPDITINSVTLELDSNEYECTVDTNTSGLFGNVKDSSGSTIYSDSNNTRYWCGYHEYSTTGTKTANLIINYGYNQTTSVSMSINSIAKSCPTTTVAETANAAGWYNVSKIHLTATAPSNIAKWRIYTNSGYESEVLYPSASRDYTLSADANYETRSSYYKVFDSMDNYEICDTLTYKIDNKPPNITITMKKLGHTTANINNYLNYISNSSYQTYNSNTEYGGGTILLYASSDDTANANRSGVVSQSCSTSGAENKRETSSFPSWRNFVRKGVTTITCTATDNAGNTSSKAVTINNTHQHTYGNSVASVSSLYTNYRIKNYDISGSGYWSYQSCSHTYKHQYNSSKLASHIQCIYCGGTTVENEDVSGHGRWWCPVESNSKLGRSDIYG